MDTSPMNHSNPNDFFLAYTDQRNKVRSRRPCDPCRRRKSRCEIVDGNPPCLLCRFHRQACTFNEEPLPRKRRAVAPEEYNHAFNHASIASDPSSYNKSLSQKATQIRKDLPIDDYAKLHGPSLLKKTLGLQQNKQSWLIGSTSEYEQTLIEPYPNEDNSDIPIGVSMLRKIDNHGTAFILSPDALTQNHQDDILDIGAIEMIVAPHGQALIYLYFRIVHPSFPILHKNVYLEKYARTHREFSPPLLAAVYLLALNWWSYSSELALLPKPNVSELERLAFKTLSNIVHRPKLSTIQSGLLLLQRPGGSSWALTSQLVGLGQDLGLHLDCSQWRIPSWERGLRKRLGWALFMQDKWGSLLHGRPSHIHPHDFDVQPLNDEDFPETAQDEDNEDGSTEVEKGRTLFCEMVKLSEILARILSSFYTIKAERELQERAQDGIRWVLETAKPLQLALRQWFSELPAVLKMEDLAARKLSSTGYLHLGYYAVEITLHRWIIRSLSSVDDETLRSICRQAAQVRLQSAMIFVSSLRPEHLQSFWYSASKYNFALIGTFISLLWATATEKEEADFYKKSLDEYRWVLRLSSKSTDFLEQALSMLATSTGVLVKAIPDVPDAERILSQNLTRAKPRTSAPGKPAGLYHVPSMAYRSESEFHEETSPENMIGETPSDSGLMGEWNIDPAWFTSLNDMGISVARHEGTNSNAMLGLGDGSVDLRYGPGQ